MASRSISSFSGLYAYDTIAHLVDDLLSRSDQNRSHALFIIDHDTLDSINGAFGRDVGDAVMAHTEKVLPAVFRATDLVARTTEDEFIVFMKDVSSLDAIECIAGLVLQLLRCPCGTEEHTVEATVTIGIGLAANGRPRSFNDLFDNACDALFQAKRSKDHRFVIFGAEGKPVHGVYGFDRLVSASTPNMRPFLDTIGNGGVLLRAEPGKKFIPQFFSDSFLALLGGMSREEALRVYGDDIVAGVHEHDRQRVRDELAEALKEGSALRTIARMQATEGNYVWVSIHMKWTRDDDGRIDAFAAHTTVESIMGSYDYASSGMQKPPSIGATLALFAVTFSEGAPDGVLLYNARGRRVPDVGNGGLADILLRKGAVHPDSEKSLRDFTQGIGEGKPHGGMLVLCRDLDDGALHWARISYLMLYDEQGVPLRASGSIRALPNTVSAQGKFFREDKLFHLVASRFLWALRVDLTADVVEEAYPVDELPVGVSYDALLTQEAARHCYADDARDVAQAFARDNVLSAVESGTFQITKEFRRDSDGWIHWTSMTVHLMENPSTHHLTAFIYIADIERRYVEAAFASTFAKPDRANGLYSKESLERIAVLLQQADVSQDPLAAVAIVRVAMPADLRAILSAEDVNSGQVYMGQQLAVCLAQEGLVAKYGADGFLVLFPRIDSESWLRERIERAVSDLRKAYVDKQGNPHPIVLAAGYSVERVGAMRFKDSVARAKHACRVNEAEPKGSVWSFDERMDMLRREMSFDDGKALRIVPPEDLERPLTGSERESLDVAMREMLMANSFDEATTAVLRVLGEAYRAHRVFTVALMENGVVSGLHEWYETGAQSIIGQVVGRTIKDYGALLSSSNACAPVVVERRHSDAEARRRGVKDVWRFIAFPVMKFGMVTGFLCVEDPRANETSVALINAVVPLLAHLRDRETATPAATMPRTRDKLTGLPGKAVFDRDAITFDPTLFHSTGLLRVALDRIYTLEGERNSDEEDRLLLYVARNLCGLFPLDSVYRTGDLELTCVCTNMSYDSFNARTTRMAAILRQRSRAGYALCDAWSDDATPLSKLIEEAATSVYGDRSILFPDERNRGLGTMPSVQRAFDGDAFSIRLQPQVDLETGKVVGSEALARCTTPDGELILPSEFVPRMEAEGDISELDYFVMEKALSTMQSWMDRGLTPLPIAVNFSRKTVSDASFIASVLAIASRYDVPENMLEIEITESMGAFKTVELRTAMETLRDQGFRFALDDLGSEYSTLSAMSDLPFDTIKLDRLLVKRFTSDPMSRSLVEGVAHACEKNGIRCVAEGVELESYIEPLVNLGCQYGQGYCFARPMTVDQFTDEYLVGAGDGAKKARVLSHVG